MPRDLTSQESLALASAYVDRVFDVFIRIEYGSDHGKKPDDQLQQYPGFADAVRRVSQPPGDWVAGLSIELRPKRPPLQQPPAAPAAGVRVDREFDRWEEEHDPASFYRRKSTDLTRQLAEARQEVERLQDCEELVAKIEESTVWLLVLTMWVARIDDSEYVRRTARASRCHRAKWKITLRCESGHEQILHAENMTGEMVRDYAGLIDGTSDLYVHPPRDGQITAVGRCQICQKKFKATVEAEE